jgi:hypothetical protein
MCDRSIHIAGIGYCDLLALKLRCLIRNVLLRDCEQKSAFGLALRGSRAVNRAQFTSFRKVRDGQERQGEKKPHSETLAGDLQPVKMIPRPKIRNNVMIVKWEIRRRVEIGPNRVGSKLVGRLQNVPPIRIRIEMQQHSIRAINRPSLDV